MTDFKKAATVVLIRPHGRDADHIGSVYLVRRAEKLAFLGGFHAFPGGRVDAADAEAPVDAPAADNVFRAAALRELFEETGVLAVTGGSMPEPGTRDTWRRESLQGDAGPFYAELALRGLSLTTSKLLPLGRWLTPAFSPTRFDAPYYALMLPPGEEPAIWPGELVSGLWIEPAEAVARHLAGELYLSFPALETLRLLAGLPPAPGSVRPVPAAESTAAIGTTAVAAPAPRPATPSGFCTALLAASQVAAERCRAQVPLPAGEMLAGIRLVPGRSRTLPPATHTNCYVIGGEELVVIDPGTHLPDEQQVLLDYLEALVDHGSRVREIWLTHHHPDHVGGIAAVQQRFGVPLATHRATRLPDGLRADRFLEDGDTLPLRIEGGHLTTWQVLYTPGHASDHLCFYEPERRTLLSGDLIVGRGTVVVGPPDGEMQAYLASLARLSLLPIRFIFPGHGPPIGDAQARIRAYIEHRREREQTIVATLARGGALSLDELVDRVYTDVPPEALPWAKLNVRAHVDKLVAEDRAREDDGRIVLSPKDRGEAHGARLR